MEKTRSKLLLFEDFSQTYEPKIEDKDKQETPDIKSSDSEKKEPVKEEEEQTSGLNATLEKCIEDVEEIVRLFEKNDKKLIDMTLPILDLCQTNLNFQEKNATGKDDLLNTSKKIIKTLVEKLRKDYANNDPVIELINHCDKL